MPKNFSYEFAIWQNLRTALEAGANTELATIDSTLEGFVRFDTPPLVGINFPSAYLEWEGCELSKSDDDAYCTQDHEFKAWVSVVGTDWTTLDVIASKYLLALNRVLDKLTAADFATTGATINGFAWEVTARQSVGFSQNRENGLFRRDAYLTLRVQFMEVATNG